MSIILLDFIGITGLARAAPSRQVPGESAKPRAFSGLRESLQVHGKGGVCIELQLEEREILRLGMVYLRIEARRYEPLGTVEGSAEELVLGERLAHEYVRAHAVFASLAKSRLVNYGFPANGCPGICVTHQGKRRSWCRMAAANARPPSWRQPRQFPACAR